MKKFNCIVVLGPTASGKTRLACSLAARLNGEVISADSRQVYQHLDIGTGKDLEEYSVDGQKINYHLIDIVHPSEQFYLHEFVLKLKKSFDGIISRKKLPIICGGTGLYLDALRKDFSLTQITENAPLRQQLNDFSKEELLKKIKTYPSENVQQVDLSSKKRLIRGVEIAEYLKSNELPLRTAELPYRPYYIGINIDVETRRQSISSRLQQRLDKGLIDEVQSLRKTGIRDERIALFGLEYKFVLRYLQNQISKDELYARLETAIFQFAKRQMTWFRKMEKEGVEIHWVNKDVDFNSVLAMLEL